jgi:DnaK suppressor protein
MTRITLPERYIPTDKEPYMSDMQVEYFRHKLLSWKEELQNESRETLGHLQEENGNLPDFNDRAAAEIEKSFELRTRDRYRKLLDKIESALLRIENKTYGYCEETGEPIGLARLDARPVATLCIEAQERHESYEKQHAEDE